MFLVIYGASALFTLLFIFLHRVEYRGQWDLLNKLEKEKNGGGEVHIAWFYGSVAILVALWPIFWLLSFSKESEDDKHV